MTGPEAAAVAPAPGVPGAAVVPASPRRRPRWPGVLSAVLALLAVAGVVTGLVLATDGAFETATWTAWAAIGASGAAVLLAVICLVAGFGRGWAAVGAIVGVLANPLVLVHGLDLIGRLGA